jgi:hypothetical protein
MACKRYSVRHALWYQDELTYSEDLRLRGPIKEISGVLQGGDVSFGDLIEKTIDSGLFPEVLKVILKPYEPTILHRLWNRYWRGRYGTDEVVSVMRNSEIAKVIADFFVLNTSWMGSLPNISNASSSILSKLPVTSGR